MPITVKFTGAAEARDRLEGFNWTRTAVAFADEVGPSVLGVLRREAPVSESEDPRSGQPGRLRDGLAFERTTALGRVDLAWTSSAPYTKWVVDGHAAPAQPILPVNARALMFYPRGGGQTFAMASPGGAYAGDNFPERVWGLMDAFVKDRFDSAIMQSMGG